MIVTLFSWGYWGWGNATRRLIEAVDAAEAAAGFEPPLFAEIRYRRDGKAKGFVGRNFERTVGSSRYEYIRGLGNRAIATGGSGIVIHQPKAIEDLLDLAFHCSHHGQRVIFFCACKCPRWCHRYKVAGLALKKAASWRRSISVVEWPGGKPKTASLDIDGTMLKAIRNGRKSVPIRGRTNWRRFAGLPWGSVVRLQAEQESLFIASGPARFSNGWFLPVIDEVELSKHAALVRSGAAHFRHRCGLEPRRS